MLKCNTGWATEGHRITFAERCLPKLVLAHLVEQWRECVDLAFLVVEGVGGQEVFVAARAP